MDEPEAFNEPLRQKNIRTQIMRVYKASGYHQQQPDKTYGNKVMREIEILKKNGLNSRAPALKADKVIKKHLKKDGKL